MYWLDALVSLGRTASLYVTGHNVCLRGKPGGPGLRFPLRSLQSSSAGDVHYRPRMGWGGSGGLQHVVVGCELGHAEKTLPRINLLRIVTRL